MNLKNFSNKKDKNPLKSLYEVEHFLNNLSCTINSYCFVKKAKSITKNNNKKI